MAANDGAVLLEHGDWWFQCCGIKWSPMTVRIPGPGYGASITVPHQCGVCTKPLPADFLGLALVHTLHVDDERLDAAESERWRRARGRAPDKTPVSCESFLASLAPDSRLRDVLGCRDPRRKY